MNKLGRKTKFRIFILMICLLASSVIFVSSSFSYIFSVYKTKQEINKLKEEYNETLVVEENLKSEINKLQDPEYMAEYAREKYLYSGKDEIIIKIDD